jgi:hypothetical protein
LNIGKTGAFQSAPYFLGAEVAEIQAGKELRQSLEELPLRKLLETLLGPEGRRRLKLRYMTSDEVFQLYGGFYFTHVKNAAGDQPLLLRLFSSYLGEEL